ncbi:MAG TPA: hypothetical protein VGJ14_05835 [Sporichthyaceae bacterium]|jgi:hypothetical protein
MGGAEDGLGRLRLLPQAGRTPAEGLRPADLCRRPLHPGQRRPACRSCNASKCNTEVTAWLRRKKLDEGAFLIKQAEILRVLCTALDPDPASALETA